MKLNRTHGAAQIDALSVASEFLMGAIRALAPGYDPDSPEVKRSVSWAQSKIAEALGTIPAAADEGEAL